MQGAEMVTGPLILPASGIRSLKGDEGKIRVPVPISAVIPESHSVIA
jgi:hypothetical protein